MQIALSRRAYDRVVQTTCGECPTGCGLSLFVKDGQVVDLQGAPEHPVSRGAVCARGSASVQHLAHPQRLRRPALRGRDGMLYPATWDEALGFVAERLKAVVDRHGPQSVLVAVSQSLDTGLTAGARRFARLLGNDQIPMTNTCAVVGNGDFIPRLPPELVRTLELVVQFGSYPDATYRQAHAVFPAASWMETDGVLFSHDRRIQWHQAAVEPLEESRSGLDFWTGLADRLGWSARFPWRTAEGRADPRAFGAWLTETTKAQIPNPKAQIPNPKSQIPKAADQFGILDLGFGHSGLLLFGRKAHSLTR